MEPVGIRKKQNSIVEVVKDAILSGNIPEGTEMTQNELANSLGVSRMPVREALIILEYQGLVQRLPNNHVKVTTFDHGYFEKIGQLCAQLETEALKERGKEPVEIRKGLFSSEMPEELLIHRGICNCLKHSFEKKTMETLLEIYIDFAVRKKMYDREKGAKELYQILELAAMEADQWQVRLENYFKNMFEVIDRERADK